MRVTIHIPVHTYSYTTKSAIYILICNLRRDFVINCDLRAKSPVNIFITIIQMSYMHIQIVQFKCLLRLDSLYLPNLRNRRKLRVLALYTLVYLVYLVPYIWHSTVLYPIQYYTVTPISLLYY